MADSGKILKMEVDYSDTVDKSLPDFQEMARVRILYYAHCGFSLIKAHQISNVSVIWNNSLIEWTSQRSSGRTFST